MFDRAYARIDIKSVNDGERVIEGIASTPSTDRMGDIVDPMGAKFALPMPMLWQHDASQPIGQVVDAKPTKNGITFRAQLASLDTPGVLKDRLDEAWQSIKLGLVRAVSIGFRANKYAFMDEGGIEFQEWEWLELSAVTIPANADCNITTIRSIDTGVRAALGLENPVTAPSEVPEAPQPTPPAIKAAGRVVRLREPARDRAPFVINEIRRTR